MIARQSRHGVGAATAAPFSASEWVMRSRCAGVTLQLGRNGSLVVLLHCFGSGWSWPHWERLRRQAKRNRAALLAVVSDRAGGDAVACSEVIL